MPRFKSINGIWKPVKEYHVNAKAKPGENPVYEGPDRAALEVLEREGVEYLGENCEEREETVIKARQMGCKNASEYLKKYKNVDLKSEKEKGEKFIEDTLFTDEDNVQKKNPVRVQSGGDDVANPKNSIKGGFGDPTDIRTGDLSKRA